MKILVVEDDRIASKVLVHALHKLGHETVETANGREALCILQHNPIRVVVSDWLMPEMDGVELCRRIRAQVDSEYTYFILLTGRTADLANQREVIEAGADDFLSKPLDLQEMWMRLRVAERILKFTTQVRELEAFLPICSYCKKIRDDQNYWQQIEGYINQRTGSEFSHSVCPDCYERVLVPEMRAIRAMPTKPKASRME